MVICLLCEPNYDLCDGDISGFCEEHQPEDSTSDPEQPQEQPQRDQPRQGRPAGDPIQGQLFDLPTWSNH